VRIGDFVSNNEMSNLVGIDALLLVLIVSKKRRFLNEEKLDEGISEVIPFLIMLKG
jgi:hypothetical protein